MNTLLQLRIDSLTQTIKHLRQQLARAKRIEASLAASEARYRAIFDYTSIGLAQLNEAGRFLEVNRAFCTLVGYDRDELLKRTYLDLTHPDDREAERRMRKQVLSGEVPELTLEKRYLRKDGSVIWAHLNLSMTRPAEGRARSLLAAIENISERRMLEDALRRIASGLATAEPGQPGGTWQWDIEADTITASDDVLQLFALPANGSPVPLKDFLNRIDTDDRPAIEHALRHAAQDKTPYRLECRVNRPDGTQRLVTARSEVYSRDNNGKPRVLIGILQDITLRRKAEQALQESEQRFRQLFDNAVDSIFIADRDGVYIDVNRSACEMLGFARDEIVGKSVLDLIPESDKERLLQAKEYFLKHSDHTQVSEWSLKRKDGSFMPVEISARILPDGRWMAIVRDIAERKRTQSELERYAAKVSDLYDNAPCGYHSINRDGVFVQINKTELGWLGYTREELVGKINIADILTESSRRKFHEQFPKFLETGRMRDIEYEFVRKDGSVIPTLANASAVLDEHGNFVMSRTSLFDMTELVEAQKRLRQAATVFEHTNDAIIITDPTGNIAAVNKAFTRITGYHPEEVIGKNPRLLKSERQDDAFYRNLWTSLEETGTWQGELWDRRKSGDLFPVWESITAVRDPSGKVTDYISVFSDISTIKETEEKLLNLAYHDSLTGLPNRLLFSDRLTLALAHAKRHGTRVALLLLDLDRFKLVNDTLGHAAGDELLQVVAGRLKETVRDEDTVARLGGDEFAIILPEVDNTSDAALLAQKIVATVSQSIHIENQVLTISTSIGISIYPDDADDAQALSKSADIAMYGAKDKGKNVYEFYTPEMSRVATELMAIDRGLRSALRHDEFVLLYQPKVDLASGRIVGIEALIRWDSPLGGRQSPARFIQVAEESDLIASIGDWVIDTACNQIQAWRAAAVPPVRLAVNLSVRQIRRPHFVDHMRDKLLACGPMDGFGLDFEVTETALQTDPHIVEALKEIKPLGVKIAIDDFGTGYSSLNSLKHLPIDVLKIDRSFIQGIPDDADDRAIATAIIAMGHSLGMSVIAEGIETEEQLQFIVDQHCDQAQGFLFYPPLSADECARFLTTSNGASVFSSLRA